MSDYVDMVLRGYEAFNRGDIDASLEILHPEIEWHTYIVPGPGGGLYHGHEGVRELWSEAQRIFGGFRNIPERLFEAGSCGWRESARRAVSRSRPASLISTRFRTAR